MRLSFFLTLGLTVLAVAVAAVASAPSTIQYQGRLNDALGNPVADGSYSIVFAIYDVPVGGVPLWTEPLNVTTSNGFFSVILGTVNALTASYFNGSERYLGLTIGADPELSPRTQIASTPFALRTQTIDGASAGMVFGDLWVSHADGSLSRVYSSGDGGAVNLYDQNSFFHSGMEPDLHGSSAGFLSIRNGVSGSALTIDGNVGGSLSPSLYMDGFGGVVNFDLSQSGDNAVLLPDNSVSATETFNEPGIASDKQTTSFALTGTMQDLATVSITIPHAGFIVLDGYIPLVNLSGTTSYNLAYFQIDSSSGGGIANFHAAIIGAQSFPTTGNYSYTVSTHRVYFRPAGTFTFRLEAEVLPAAGGTATAYYPSLTAVYYPTSYGSVSTLVSAEEAASFESAAPVAAPDISPAGGTIASDSYYQVDLRELELKAAKERAEYEAAQRALAEARLQEQINIPKSLPSEQKQ